MKFLRFISCFWLQALVQCLLFEVICSDTSQYYFEYGAQVKDVLYSKTTRIFQEQNTELPKSSPNISAAFGVKMGINLSDRLIIYFVFDVTRSVGRSNFEKSIDFAKAIVEKVGISKNGTRAGALRFNSKADIVFLPMQFETTKDVLDALDRTEYKADGSAVTSVLSLIRQECIPLSQDFYGIKNVRSVIFVLTDELPLNSPLYSPDKLGWALAWKYNTSSSVSSTHRLRAGLYLKEIVLPIQPEDRCIHSLVDNRFSASFFTNRMFCAGDGRGETDTCKGDSGGPIMQRQMNSEGYLYWTQVGIISWGIGSRRKSTYGYYSHVQRLRPWIDRAILEEVKDTFPLATTSPGPFTDMDFSGDEVFTGNIFTYRTSHRFSWPPKEML